MKADVKEKWLKALRSGDYEQGQGVLHSKDAEGEQFCCLGVLCDIAVKEGVISPPRVRNDEYDEKSVYIYGKESFEVLSPTVRKWAGLEENVPVVDAGRDEFLGDNFVGVAELNDDWDWDFNRIADAVEKSL